MNVDEAPQAGGKSVREITQHGPRETNPAIRQKKPEFHQVFAQLNGRATTEVAADRRMIRMNAVMPQLLGVPPDRIHHARVLDFFAEEDQQRLEPLLKEPPDEPVHLTGLTAQCGDRGPRNVEVTVVRLRHDGANCLLIFHDLDARAATVDHSSAYRQVLDHVTDSTFMADKSGNLCNWNTAAARLFGWTKQEVIGQNAFSLFFVEEDPDVKDLMRSIEIGMAWRRDCLMQRKSGETFIARVESGPILDHKEKPMGMFVVCRDRAHELTVQELGLKKARMVPGGDEELKKRFQDRHRLIHQGTQEAKNPLTSMRLQLDVLDQELPAPQDEKIASSIKSIERNIERTRHLLDLLTEAAMIERHGIELDPDAVYLDELIQKTIQDLAAAARQRQVRIVLDIDPNVMVWGDLTQLSQVYTMILTNGLECTPPGGFIRVIGRQKGDEVEIRITDTGVGLDPEQMETIFRPFPPMERKTPISSGLSLYIAKGIVEAHRGTIQCDSGGPGKGTRFTIRLPAQESVEAIQSS